MRRMAAGVRAAAPLALLAGAISLPLAAQAQTMGGGQLVLDGAPLALAPSEMTALAELRATFSRPQPAQDKALAAARSVASGEDARYVLALYTLEIARTRDDDSLRVEALDVLIASSRTPRDKLAGHLATRGAIALRRGDPKTAENLWDRALALRPGDPDLLAGLAQVRQGGNDAAGAYTLIDKAIAGREAAKKRVPEEMYRQRMSLAHQAHLVRPGIEAGRVLARNFPTAKNWRDALVVYRQLVAPTGDLEIELLRLMRATDALTKADEYLRMAQLLEHAGQPVEARAVLDEGYDRILLHVGESPALEISAEVDRAIAALKGKAPASPPARDPVAADVQRGRQLFLAGQRPEAELAFRAAAGVEMSPFADLARFWLDWLARRPG